MSGLVDVSKLRIQAQECQACGRKQSGLWVNVGPERLAVCHECMKEMAE